MPSLLRLCFSLYLLELRKDIEFFSTRNNMAYLYFFMNDIFEWVQTQNISNSSGDDYKEKNILYLLKTLVNFIKLYYF